MVLLLTMLLLSAFRPLEVDELLVRRSLAEG